MNLLEVKGLKKSFVEKKAVFPAVKGIDLTIAEGECLGLVGESGCGKSTTAYMVARLIREDEGEIYFNGKKLNAGRRLTCAGRDLQMVFQSPKDSFDPRYTVLQSVMMGADSYHLWGRKELEKKSLELIEFVGLKTAYADVPVMNLSGGECQRAAIARALLCDPRLIIFDEATSALDVSLQAQVIQLLRRLKRERNVSFLFITHDLALTASICDRIAVMYAGRIVEVGGTKEILDQPVHPYTRQLLASVLPVTADGSYRFPVMERLRETEASGCEYYDFCNIAADICAKKVPGPREYRGREMRCHCL
ncbi:ABC transporter ATP-binding protein [Ruminococcus sp. OA3]|uniref:ABC transporter ATP-binding protein n=1 Tax=Ruminococcus sp. OA3 TaxID=2914164 RepID=UPI001F0666E4|nr:ABC transporter ATP-binding protein [Ruminococcus sp. OA3]MCH1982695.1 ABC transporter ATP-binding protein [Ruminococcus sp. OA3]